MKHLSGITIALSLSVLLLACSGFPFGPTKTASSADPFLKMIDTAKLKSDLEELMNGIASGNPDTAKLKEAGAGILSTAASILSDTGISALSGNSSDPASQTAKTLLIKMRNAMGVRPSTLDSLRDAARMLSEE